MDSGLTLVGEESFTLGTLFCVIGRLGVCLPLGDEGSTLWQVSCFDPRMLVPDNDMPCQVRQASFRESHKSNLNKPSLSPGSARPVGGL